MLSVEAYSRVRESGTLYSQTLPQRISGWSFTVSCVLVGQNFQKLDFEAIGGRLPQGVPRKCKRRLLFFFCFRRGGVEEPFKLSAAWGRGPSHKGPPRCLDFFSKSIQRFFELHNSLNLTARLLASVRARKKKRENGSRGRFRRPPRPSRPPPCCLFQRNLKKLKLLKGTARKRKKLAVTLWKIRRRLTW